MSAVLSRLWRPMASRRSPTPAALFGQAARLRRVGRYADAAELVSQGLSLDPASITGHLLAAYLHAASRKVEPARQEFQWVLERDPLHPRALLGLARLALEAGDFDGGRETLVRALRAYPDFPEARALLDGLATRQPTAAPARLDRLRVPPGAQALLALGADGTVMVATPAAAADGAPHVTRTMGLATAALQRAGFGALRRGVVESAASRHFFRADGTLVLAVWVPRTIHITQGLLEVNRLWAAAQHQLAVANDKGATGHVARRES